MLIERKWKKWVYFYLPMAVFIVFTLFPFYWMAVTAFRPDRELYRTWRQANATPFWTLEPTLEHVKGLLQTTAFPQWLWNTMLIAIVSTDHLAHLRHVRRLRAGAPEVPRLGVPRHRDLHHLPRAADAAVHPARRHHPRHAPRQHALGADAHLSDVPDPVLHLAADGLLQDHPEGARGMRAHRRRDALRRDGADHLPGGGPGHPLGRHLRLHAVVERVHLRADLHVLGGA